MVVVACVAIAIEIPYWIPKRQVLSVNDAYIGYYRGLGLIDRSGYFGRNWYRVVVHEDLDGYWEVDVTRLGYNQYRGYYRNGVLREEGLCMVEENGGGADITPIRTDLLNAKFYDPKGNLISEVKNKTGRQILCNPNGKPFWQLDLLDGQYTSVKMWHSNGQLIHESHYKHGVPHGTSIANYPNGQVEYRGVYSDGKRVGVWVRYAEDGTLESETDHGETSPAGQIKGKSRGQVHITDKAAGFG